jgi:hypothetical protein
MARRVAVILLASCLVQKPHVFLVVESAWDPPPPSPKTPFGIQPARV